MIGEESSCMKEKPRLLKKYDLIIDNLSYEYIKKCKDVKTLEKIIKILRSGEEGNFPDLIKFAESQLRDVSPNNRLLIKPEPIPSLSSLNVNDRNKISYEMASWSEEIKKHDSLLKGADDKESSDIPPIRSYGENINMKKIANANKKSRIQSLDYDAWDKYDADKEIMKMEIEEEREREEISHRMEKKHLDNNPDTPAEMGHYSDLEKQVYSIQEKDRGNECFQAEQYEQATYYYTKSISILPNVAAYNNRAIANLKLKKYGEVIMDCNEVLKRDADNVKALFRRGNAHESKGFYSEAMKDFERVLEFDPNNNAARLHVSQIKKKLEETNEDRPKKARMVVEDMKSFEEELKSIQIFDKKIQPNICSKPSIPNWKGHPCDSMASGDNKLNEWGYPRVVCNCTSIPRALQKKHIPHQKDPGKNSIQIANKYSSIQGNKHLPRYENTEKVSNQLREKNIDARVHSFGDNSCQAVQPLRDMPLLASDSELATSNEVSGGPHFIDNKESESVVFNADMQESNDQPMEISKEDNCFKELDMESPSSPYNFLKIWNQITDDESLNKHANLLKKISPSNLSTVIGEKLDGYMLSTIISCLHLHFNDEDLLLEFLIGISQLPRFKTVHLFLSAQEKKVVKSLFQKLEQSGRHQIPEGLKTSYEL